MCWSKTINIRINVQYQNGNRSMAPFISIPRSLYRLHVLHGCALACEKQLSTPWNCRTNYINLQVTCLYTFKQARLIGIRTGPAGYIRHIHSPSRFSLLHNNHPTPVSPTLSLPLPITSTNPKHIIHSISLSNLIRKHHVQFAPNFVTFNRNNIIIRLDDSVGTVALPGLSGDQQQPWTNGITVNNITGSTSTIRLRFRANTPDVTLNVIQSPGAFTASANAEATGISVP